MSFRRFAEVALALAAAASLRGDVTVSACAWVEPEMSDLTTFDPAVAGEPAAEGLFYNPFIIGFGGACNDCMRKESLAEWHEQLKGTVSDADWEKILFQATPGELTALRARVSNRQKPAPAGYETSSIWSVPAAERPRLEAALTFVELARRVEPLATLGTPGPSSGSPYDEALARLASAREPFFRQRYAFLALRLLFYGKAWPQLLAFAEKQAATLAKPSPQIAWRTRWYVAGAYRRSGQRARANLELARIHMSYPPLSGAVVEDFKPAERADWQEAFKLARTVREKTELWRLAGMRSDGLGAMQQIFKLDPKSTLLALLAVRELERIESLNGEVAFGGGGPEALAAQKQDEGTLEELAAKVAATPGADRPWLMELVAGHLAARRGDLAVARPRLERAVAARPGDKRVASQARASLAMAIAQTWKGQPAEQAELARAIAGLDGGYRRTPSVRRDVRERLARAYAAGGDLVEAEMLQPGYLERDRSLATRWADRGFIQKLIARTEKAGSDFDRFVLSGTYTRARLEMELGARALVDGDYAAAAATMKALPEAATPLGTDPFVIHIRDCHDCDRERYATAPWTDASFAARLGELERKARGTGEAAAQAAFDLGAALYNITWFGNARVVVGDTHSATRETAFAERWFKRAFDLTRNRELKAKAATMAAKCEMAALTSEEDEHHGRLPVPVRWYPVIKQYGDTKYYQEVLAECSHFRRWLGQR